MVIVILVPNFNNPIKLVLPSIFFYETDNIHMWCNTILLDLMEIFKTIMDENDQFDRNVKSSRTKLTKIKHRDENNNSL